MKISLITVCYNSAATIRDTIESVLAQTYPYLEYIIVDGASTDGTPAIVQAYHNKIARFISEPDKGLYDAMNKGIALASGEVIGFLHADDIYAHPNVLTDIAAAFKQSSTQAVYGDLHYVQQQDTSQVIRYWKSARFTPNQLAWGWMPAHPTLYVRRERYQRIGGFDTHYRIAADYFSILQLFSQPDFQAVYLPQVLVKMRVGGKSNRSLKNILQKSREDYHALRRTQVGGLGALFWKNFHKLNQFFPA